MLTKFTVSGPIYVLLNNQNLFLYFLFQIQKGKAVFRAHASRIMNRFSATVDCLQLDGGLEEIQDLWRVVGTSHSRHNISQKAFKVMFIG